MPLPAAANIAPLLLSPDVVREAAVRLRGQVTRTPLLSCELLNGWLGHEVLFKYEGMQKIGAFKIRGALNALLALKEQGEQFGPIFVPLAFLEGKRQNFELSLEIF